MIKGVDVTFIHSGDASLAEWFADVFGLEKHYDDGHWIEFDVDGSARFAIDVVGDSGSVVERQAIMISFRVKDIKEAVASLSQRGVELYPAREGAIFDVGPALVATFKDIDGNWHQLSQQKAPADGQA